MPRGVTSIEFISPVKGARFDLPVHKLEPDMLAAGSFNVVCDPTSVLRSRNGFTAVPGGHGPAKPLTGGISWEGIGGTVYTLVADTENWWQYVTGAASPWVPLAGMAPIGPDDFTVFANFPVSGVDNLFGVNNNTTSGLLRWVAGNTSIAPVTGLPFTAARGCFVLANRLVVYGTTESDGLHPYRVRWSQVNNPTSFTLASLADLADPGGSIKAGLRMGNLQGFFYMAGTEGTGALQMMIAQVGDDANAFSFQEFALGEGVVPPVSVAAIMAVEGIHYYLGLDGHIWAFNGISVENIGIPIQADIQANANLANLKHSFAVYVPSDRHGRFFFPSINSYPDRCVYYSFDFQRWEAPAVYLTQFRSGFSGPFSAATEEAAFMGGTDGILHQLDVGLTDNGQPIAFNATWGAVNTDPLQEMAIQFAEAFVQQGNRSDVLALTISGLRNPLDTLTTGASFLMSLNQANQFQQISAPGRDNAGNRYYNWVQASLQGSVAAGMACLGGYVHVNTQQKGVYQLRGAGPE